MRVCRLGRCGSTEVLRHEGVLRLDQRTVTEPEPYITIQCIGPRVVVVEAIRVFRNHLAGHELNSFRHLFLHFTQGRNRKSTLAFKHFFEFLEEMGYDESLLPTSTFCEVQQETRGTSYFLMPVHFTLYLSRRITGTGSVIKIKWMFGKCCLPILPIVKTRIERLSL